MAEWGAGLIGKGMTVNAGKSKVMVGSSGGKMIVNSENWPCDVCEKGVQALCSVYIMLKKWIHKVVQWCAW